MSAGELLREWRHRRRMSQLALALAAGTSARHVSLVETGKTRPSADMVLRLAARLDVPFRDRNRLLLAAGHAPRYRERPLDGRDLTAAHEAVVTVLRAHEPYPAVVIDRQWNVLLMNRAAEPFIDGVDPELLKPPINMVRLGLHPRGLAPRIVKLAQVRAVFRARLSRQLAKTHDPEVAALYDEFLTAADDAVSADAATTVPIESEIVIPMIVRYRGRELRLFSTVTTFGTPQDVTLEEIAIESYYPAGAPTAEFLRHQDLGDAG